jgi:hypothetical protein
MPASDCLSIVVNCEDGDNLQFKAQLVILDSPHFSLSQETTHALRALMVIKQRGG